MGTFARSAVAAVFLLLPAFAQGQTITFEGLINDAPIPNGYGAVNWSNMYVADVTTPVYSVSGYRNGVISGSRVGYNGYGSPASILESSSPFTLGSGYFTAAWNDALNLSVTGYVGGVATYFQNAVLNTSGPSYLTFNWADVSQVSFVSTGGVSHGYNGYGTQFAVDNLTLAQVTATPEPASLTLLATGIAGIAGAVKRRRKARIDA